MAATSVLFVSGMLVFPGGWQSGVRSLYHQHEHISIGIEID
jgi:hypothetical protein